MGLFTSLTQRMDSKAPQMGGKSNPLSRAIGAQLMKKLVNISEYLVTFHIGPFIKMFLYHLIFYFTGPFIILVILTFDNISLARNMMFYGCSEGLSRSVFSQYLFFGLSTPMLVLTIFRFFEIEPIPGLKIEL